jgi:septal ring factor EnvC (AmiA/AmiB activator)
MEPIVYDPRAKERAVLARLASVVSRVRSQHLKHVVAGRAEGGGDDVAMDALRQALQQLATLEERLALASVRADSLEQLNLSTKEELQMQREANAVLREQLAATTQMLRESEAELAATLGELESLNAEIQQVFEARAAAPAEEATPRGTVG